MTDRQFNIYRKLFEAGCSIGCHQREDRSFFVGNWQFPVCARCTGVLFGQILMLGLLAVGVRISLILDLAFLAIMFIDWLVQYIGILQSTNIRRLITGLLAGSALTSVYFKILQMVLHYLIN